MWCSYGPRETKFRDEFSLLGQITCELKFATFSSAKRGQHQQSTAEKEAGMIVKEALAPAVQLVCMHAVLCMNGYWHPKAGIRGVAYQSLGVDWISGQNWSQNQKV